MLDAGRQDGRLVREAFEGSREPELVPLPDGLAPAVTEGLQAAGVEALYSHQAQALEQVGLGLVLGVLRNRYNTTTAMITHAFYNSILATIAYIAAQAVMQKP